MYFDLGWFYNLLLQHQFMKISKVASYSVIKYMANMPTKVLQVVKVGSYLDRSQYEEEEM